MELDEQARQNDEIIGVLKHASFRFPSKNNRLSRMLASAQNASQ